MMQPQGYGRPPVQWMPQVQPQPNCPPGLEYLSSIDVFLVHQQVELLEAFVGFEQGNKYEIKNGLGQRVYLAVETTDCCTRQCCGNSRPFDVKIYDSFQREVLRIKRYLRSDSCWCPCCLQKVEVFTPNEELLGSVKQNWTVCKPQYDIRDADDNTMLRIQGPCCTCSCGGDVVFELQDRTGTQPLGKISKQWSGGIKELFTDADNFVCQFPLDLDVKTKAVILGACLLIDFMFFEKEQGKHNDGLGMLG